MHPRNFYAVPPDFLALAEAYPNLKAHLVHTNHSPIATINFKSEKSQRCLTEALLHRDFGLGIKLAQNRLCPPIPNRLNYVLWIQDIVSESGVGENVSGIDIGTGASAIYPLIACAQKPSWHFTATDVDELSLAHARENVAINGLCDRIHIVKVSPDEDIFLPLASYDECRFDFTMCNPPFYSSTKDIIDSASAKEYDPQAVCTGADVEMITPGGESAFVCRMVVESLQHRTRCRWYTSMVGKIASLASIVDLLHEHSIDNYGITEFVQGQTRRWAIAWSFSDIRLSDSISRIPNPALHKLMPAHNTITQTYHPRTNNTLEERMVQLESIINTIDAVSYKRSPIQAASLVIHATRNTWSRSARRNKTVLKEGHGVVPERMECRATLTAEPLGSFGIELQWKKGKDRPLFEGLCSHITRKLGVSLK